MDHAGGQGQALFPAAGKLAGQLVLALRQAQAGDAFAHGLAAVLDGIHAGHEVEVFLDGQVLVKAETLGHVADLALDGVAVGDDVVAEANALAFVGAQQAAQHADEGGFAAAVGAEEAADFSGADLEVNVVHGGDAAEPLGHAAHVNGEIAQAWSGAERTSTGWPG